MLYSKALSLALLVSFPILAMEKGKGPQPQPNPAETPKEIKIWNKKAYAYGETDVKKGLGTTESPYKSEFSEGQTTLIINGECVEIPVKVDPVIVEKTTKKYLGLSSTKQLEVKKEAQDPQYCQELKELSWTRAEDREVTLKADKRLNIGTFGSMVREHSKKITGSHWVATEGKELSKPLSKNEVAVLAAAVLEKKHAEEKAKLDKLIKDEQARAEKARQEEAARLEKAKKDEAAQTEKTQMYSNEMERRAHVLQLVSDVRDQYDVDEQIRLAENEAAKVKEQTRLAKEKEKYTKSK